MLEPKKNNTLAITVWAIVGVSVSFTIGRFIAPPAIKENSMEYLLAKAEASGKERARIKAEAIAKEAVSDFRAKQEKNLLKQAEEIKKQQEVLNKVDALQLIPIEDFNNWKDIGDGWQIRGIYARKINFPEPRGEDITLEYSLRRVDNKRPKLTRIVVEIFDSNKEFVFPCVVDISAADAGLTYVRTGAYYSQGKTLVYCRVALSEVNIVKYVNQYPTYKSN